MRHFSTMVFTLNFCLCSQYLFFGNGLIEILSTDGSYCLRVKSLDGLYICF
nr:hypothetical protein [uncultured bacterium]